MSRRERVWQCEGERGRRRKTIALDTLLPKQAVDVTWAQPTARVVQADAEAASGNRPLGRGQQDGLPELPSRSDL